MSDHREKIQEDADEWLEQYTFHSMNSCPEPSTIETLVQSFPYDGGTVYRGMNFQTDAEYSNFLEATKGGTVWAVGAISSWTRQEGTAYNFAVTRPTYDLNRELMEAESLRRKNNDHMIGVAGVILEIQIPAGIAIDVTKTRHGKEDEIILPPGTYSTSLRETLRPFVHSINERNYLEELAKPVIDGRRGFDEIKFNHIINRFEDFTVEARKLIFDRIFSGVGAVESKVYVDSCSDYVSGNHREKIPKISLDWNISDDFFTHYDKFLGDDRLKIDSQLDAAVRQIDDEFDRLTVGIDWQTQHFHLDIHPSLKIAIADSRVSPRFVATINSAVREFYHETNSLENLSRINGLSGKEKRREQDSVGRKCAHALSQLISKPRDKMKKNALEALSRVDAVALDARKRHQSYVSL